MCISAIHAVWIIGERVASREEEKRSKGCQEQLAHPHQAEGLSGLIPTKQDFTHSTCGLTYCCLCHGGSFCSLQRQPGWGNPSAP